MKAKEVFAICGVLVAVAVVGILISWLGAGAAVATAPSRVITKTLATDNIIR